MFEQVFHCWGLLIIVVWLLLLLSVWGVLCLVQSAHSNVERPRLEDFDTDKRPGSPKGSPIYEHEDGRISIQFCSDNETLHLEDKHGATMWFDNDEREWLRRFLNALKGEN